MNEICFFELRKLDSLVDELGGNFVLAEVADQHPKEGLQNLQVLRIPHLSRLSHHFEDAVVIRLELWTEALQ